MPPQFGLRACPQSSFRHRNENSKLSAADHLRVRANGQVAGYQWVALSSHGKQGGRWKKRETEGGGIKWGKESISYLNRVQTFESLSRFWNDKDLLFQILG